MSGTVTREALWSKLLFNNVHALRIAAVIDASGGEIDSVTLQRELAIGQSTVHRVLKMFEGVELLERLDRASRTEPLKFRRAQHPFWAAAAELLVTAESETSVR